MSPLGLPIWLMVFWLFAVGGCVGSFLNVVVYRLPLGISLVYPPSHCPKCGKHIPWYDNVPIFGWIMLRGRCRQCHNPISARYPIVEAITAAMFGLLAVAELNQLTTTYPFHMLLLCTLICAGLIEYDGNRPPAKLFVPAFIVGALMPLIWPALRWLPARGLTPASLDGMVDGLAGLAAGALLGGLAWGTLTAEKPKGLALGLVGVGLFLGWQAVLVIAAVTALLIAPMWLPEHVSPRLRVPSSIVLGLVTLGLIVVCARLVSF